MFDKFIQSMAHSIYGHVTSYLPWGYNDPIEGVALSVEKLVDGDLRVTTVKGGVPVEQAIHVVVIPKAEIENLMKK